MKAAPTIQAILSQRGRIKIQSIRGRVWVAVLASTLFSCLSLYAQVPEFPDTVRSQTITAQTERFESTQNTSLIADYTLKRDGWNGIFRTSMSSSSTLFGSPTTYDQIDVLSDMEYAFPSSLRLFMLAEGTLTNDLNVSTLIPGINNTAATFVGIGGRAVDANGNLIGVAVGGAYNRQLNTEDAGGAVYGEIKGETDISGYTLALDGNGRWYNTAPRHSSNGDVAMQISRLFEGGASGNLDARYQVINTDLYIKRQEEDVVLYGGPTYDGIRQRNEDRFDIYTALSYPMDDDVMLDVNFTTATLAIRQEETDEGLPPLPRDPDPFQYDRQDLALGISIGTSWLPEDGYLNVRLQYSSNEQRNSVDAKVPVSEVELKRVRSTNSRNDFISEQLLLGGEAWYTISRVDTLFLRGSVGIYRYDTPDTTNNFDRDEQTVQAEIRYARSFSPMLDFTIYGQAFLTHLVYLFGENSNDNNWNRIFRIVPSVRYHWGGVLDNKLQAEIVANYTEYDFEGRTQNIRGRSFRQLTLRDSVGIPLSATLTLLAIGEIRIAERGSFSWVQFAESLLDRTRTEGLEVGLSSSGMDPLVFGIGGKLSRVKNFRVDPRGELEPFSDRTSIGPTASIRATLSEHSDIQCTGWWEHRFNESALIDRVPWLTLTIGLQL